MSIERYYIIASFSSSLPAPKRVYSQNISPKEDIKAIKQNLYPPYGKRAGFVPKSEIDFGDGGAFPEIHVYQYDF